MDPDTENSTEPDKNENTSKIEPGADAPESPKPVETNGPAKKRINKWWYIGGGVILALIIASIIVGLSLRHGSTAQNNQASSSQTPPKKQVKESPTPEAAQPDDNSSTATFLTSPKIMPNLHFFANYRSGLFSELCTGDSCAQQRAVNDSDVTYYQIGSIGSNAIIALTVAQDVPGGPVELFALQTGADKYAILANYTDLARDPTSRDSLQKSLSSTVTIDSSTSIPAMEFPKEVNLGGATLAVGYAPVGSSYASGYLMPNGLKDIRSGQLDSSSGLSDAKVGTVGGHDIYEVVSKTGTGYQLKEWYATLNQDLAVSYNFVGPLKSSDDGSTPAQITWTGGKVNTSSFMNPFLSCGTDGYMVASDTTTDQLNAIGSTPSNQTVYALANNSPLFMKAYTEDYDKGSFTESPSLKNLSLQQFQDAHSVIAMINSRGEIQIYFRADMFSPGGCAKPVVYLYPTKPTIVDVKVGANVTKSVPFYPHETGWQNVLAWPSGQLGYQGNSYSSLFWEGHGAGPYPAITRGTIVRGNQAAATIRQQLAEQGLNSREINDFMTFWGSRLPNTPYVRLTWLGTKEMQRIAPLNVSPKPDTVIRVFLDFEGLAKPVKLAPQVLSAPARNGFTVVEWGGLLRGNIH